MGFGKSETPHGREYSLKVPVENLTNLIEAIDLRNITLVMQDWGGPIGSAFTLRHPDRVKRLFLLNTLAGYGNAEFDPNTPWFQFIHKHHEAGTLSDILGHQDVNVLSIMKIIGLENLSAVNSDWLAAYGPAFPAKEDCIGAIEFRLDVLLGRVFPYFAEGFPLVDNLKSKPAMLAVGMKDRSSGIAHDSPCITNFSDRPFRLKRSSCLRAETNKLSISGSGSSHIGCENKRTRQCRTTSN